MLVDAHQQRPPGRSLSGGVRARVLLAKLLLQPANLLVLDEPTNDLYAPTLAALEEMLEDFAGTALVVTHDRWFLERVATAILAFEDPPPDGNRRPGQVRLWQGNYSTWRALAGGTTSVATAAKVAAVPAASKPPPKKGLSFNEKRELDGLMPEIERREAELATLEAQLGDPQLYVARGAEVATKLDQKARMRSELDALIARWEELESRSGT